MSTEAAILTRLASIRRRASLHAGLAALPWALALALSIFVVAALAVGPAATPRVAALPFALIVLVLLSPLFFALRRYRALRGDAVVRLLDASHHGLADKLRVALDVVAEPPRYRGSKALADAHLALVVEGLMRVRPREIISFRSLLDTRSALAGGSRLGRRCGPPRL